MVRVPRNTSDLLFAHPQWRPVHACVAETDRWFVIPQDLEDAFATDSRDGYRSCAAEGWPCKDSYCYLSCPSFNSVFMCDKDHPQDLNERSTYNRACNFIGCTAARRRARRHDTDIDHFVVLTDLASAVLWNPVTKDAYMTRLKDMLNRCVRRLRWVHFTLMTSHAFAGTTTAPTAGCRRKCWTSTPRLLPMRGPTWRCGTQARRTTRRWRRCWARLRRGEGSCMTSCADVRAGEGYPLHAAQCYDTIQASLDRCLLLAAFLLLVVVEASLLVLLV